MDIETDNVALGFYGFPDAAQAHLELLMNQYVAALSGAINKGETVHLALANELRDHLVRSLELAVVATQMDGQSAEDLMDAWARVHTYQR